MYFDLKLLYPMILQHCATMVIRMRRVLVQRELLVFQTSSTVIPLVLVPMPMKYMNSEMKWTTDDVLHDWMKHRPTVNAARCDWMRHMPMVAADRYS